jgi:hypothetical protein
MTTNEVTKSETIWKQLKESNFDIFGLTDQRIEKFCKFVNVDAEKCYLVCTVSGVLPALEDKFGKDFTFELVDKYVVVTRKE